MTVTGGALSVVVSWKVRQNQLQLSVGAVTVTGHRRDERGIVHAVELVYATLVMILIIAVVAFLGRSAVADSRVNAIPRVAARAGSLEHSSDEAASTAKARALSDSKALGCDVHRPEAVTVVTALGPGDGWLGGSLTVHVQCTVHNGRLATIWIPGDRTFIASDTEAIEANRG